MKPNLLMFEYIGIVFLIFEQFLFGFVVCCVYSLDQITAVEVNIDKLL